MRHIRSPISMKFRTAARKLNIRKRFMALTSQEKIISKKYYRIFYISLIKSVKTDDEDLKFKYIKVAQWAYCKYLLKVVDPGIVLPPPARYDRTIDSFSESQCWNFFECRKEDLYRLLRELKFPTTCHFDNQGKLSGEEVLLRGLYELVSGEDQFSIAENVFGRDQSYQSRAFTFFIDHIYSTFLDLLTDNLQWWKESGLLEQSRAAIQRKLESRGFQFSEDELNTIFAFIDCNCLECCRVGGGPRGDGPDADRWQCNIQRAFYNGWKSIHGLKHQTVDIAHGFTIDMFGPTSLRRNDLFLLGKSRLTQRLAELFAGEAIPYNVYGDSIYPHLPHLRSSWRGVNGITDEQKAENNAYKSVRISIEWNYGVTSNLFQYLRNLDKLKVMNNSYVVKVYTVATLLRNCHVALYGGISSSYFELSMPDDMLQKYLRQEPLIVN
jgi:hypothetical protein